MNIARSTVLNAIGFTAPLPLAILVIPILLESLGEQQFGLLTLIWAVTTYFGLFDLGLGRALTLRLAVLLDQGRSDLIGSLSLYALGTIAFLGTVGTILLYLLAPYAAGLLKGQPSIDETTRYLRLMSLALPFIVLTSGLRGILEARRAFGVINYIRIPLGIWTFAGPWLVIEVYRADLALVIYSLVAGRILACLAHAAAVLRVLPQLRGPFQWQVDIFSPLAHSGGWMTVSNLVGPIMGYADRFILGSLVSVAAVTYYATPQEIVSKMWIIPGALTTALFPTFATLAANADSRLIELCEKALTWLIFIMLPLALGLSLFAHELLSSWLGMKFAAHATLPLQAFGLGLFFGALAQIPYTALQSAGYASRTALIHLLELPIFVAALVLAATAYGIDGAAIVWLLRCVLDSAALFFVGASAIRINGTKLFGTATIKVIALAAATFLGIFLDSPVQRVAFFCFVCTILGLAGAHLWRERYRTIGSA